MKLHELIKLLQKMATSLNEEAEVFVRVDKLKYCIHHVKWETVDGSIVTILET